MDVCRFLVVGAAIALLSAVPGVGSASLPAVDPYVDVYVPGGIDGDTRGEMRVDTPNYAFTHHCGRSVATGLWVRHAASGDVQVFDAKDTVGGPGCHELSACVNGKRYSVTYDNTPKYIHFRKSGKYMWEVLIEGIKLRNSSGEALPLSVSQTFYFWPDKIYTYFEIRATADIAGIEYAELSSRYRDGLFDHVNNGTVDGQLGVGASWIKGVPAVPDSFTLFGAGSKVSVTQSVVDKTDLDLWRYEAHQGQGDAPSVTSHLWIWNKDAHAGQSMTWTSDTVKTVATAYYVSPEGSSTPGLRETACDAHPLDDSQFVVKESNPAVARFKGFDPRRGCYNVEFQIPGTLYWDVDKHFVAETEFEVKNDAQKRNVRIRTYDTPEGHAMANIVGTFAVLCDADRNPTGVPIQVSKKWDGNTHPNYHETYVCLPFEAKESQTYRYRTAYHMWGTKTLVGIPSLDLIDWPGVYGPWYETHIGNCETACYAPDDRIHALVQDIRAQGGTQLQGNAGSNWYDNAGGVSLTSIVANGEIQRMKRRAPGLRWTSPGPCLAEQTWLAETFPDVPAAQTKVSTYLLPSMRNTRIFYRYRTEFKERQPIANMRTDVRLFTLNEENYSPVQVPNVISYLGADGKTADLHTDYSSNRWLCIGTPLSPEKPFVAGHSTITGALDPRFYPAGVNNNGFVVHSFSGKIGGKKVGMGNLSLSAFLRTDTKCVLSLTPNIDASEIRPGDYVDLLVEVFTWRPDDGNTAAIETERLCNPTAVHVETGFKVSDFPACVKSSKGLADFSVTGGVGFNVISASGFTGRVPVLEELVSGAWVQIDQSVKGKDWWQTDYVPADRTYTFTFAVPAPEKGGTKRYRVRCQ